SPNKSSKDLRSINVTKLGKGCFAEANGVCLASAPQVPTPHKWNACDASGNTTDADDLAFMSKYGISKCMSSDYGTDDYWAGAAELCGGTSKMASMVDLAKIANYVYNTDIVGEKTDNGSGYDDADISYDSTKAAELGLPSSAGFFLWSGEETDSGSAYSRYFGSDNTDGYYRISSGGLVVCLGD
ncbi:hypothetical protein IJZ97_03135, partial [bacterium]|nr:hypothetical protein [bacterium]